MLFLSGEAKKNCCRSSQDDQTKQGDAPGGHAGVTNLLGHPEKSEEEGHVGHEPRRNREEHPVPAVFGADLGIEYEVLALGCQVVGGRIRRFRKKREGISKLGV
jgi:hypothetical protein